VFGKLPAARKRKDRQRNRLARSQRLRLSREPKARWRPGSADRTAPEQISQAPGLREFRLAASQQILPLIGNRKPASDRGHWLQPAPCSSRRRSCPGGERGDRQSSVPADSTPSRASPTGKRIGGYDYKTESFQRPRAEQHAHSREIRNSNFFGAPSPGGRSVREITSREETESPPEESARQIPACSSLPGTESLLEIWLGRSNRSRAGLAGTWTTRVQARRVPADPTADRKPKACQ